MEYKETEQSKIFPNKAFGYNKIVVERPLRLSIELGTDALKQFQKVCEKNKEKELSDLVLGASLELGKGPHIDFNQFVKSMNEYAEKKGFKCTGLAKGMDKLANCWLKSLDGSVAGATLLRLSNNCKQDFVTIIPEPATICLLGFGALALRKRRRV